MPPLGALDAPFTQPWADNLGLAVSTWVLVCETILARRCSSTGITAVELGHYRLMPMSRSFKLQYQAFLCLQAGKSVVTAPCTQTGYGISENKKYLILLTIDGRQKDWSLGASTSEVGYWLKYFGAWEGLNMDGGGSTSLAALVPGEKQDEIRLLNQPSGGERKVGNNLGVYLVPVKQ